YCLRRPGGSFGLEEDRPVLHPEPRPALADLGLRSPAEPVRVTLEGVEPDLLLVRCCAGGNEQREVGERRLPRAGAARLGRQIEHVDRLAGPVLTRRLHSRLRRSPEISNRVLFADHHPRPAGLRRPRERVAALPRGNHVRTQMTQRRQAPAFGERREPSEPAPGYVLEEDALDGILGAKGEDLAEGGLERRGHGSNALYRSEAVT